VFYVPRLWRDSDEIDTNSWGNERELVTGARSGSGVSHFSSELRARFMAAGEPVP
jgi:hypothetical protein